MDTQTLDDENRDVELPWNEIIPQARFREITQGDLAFEKTFLSVFIEDVGQEASRLAQALNTRDPRQAGRVLHSLAGILFTVADDAPAGRCRDAQIRLERETSEILWAEVAEIEVAIGRYLRAVESHREHLEASSGAKPR